VTSGQSGDSSM